VIVLGLLILILAAIVVVTMIARGTESTEVDLDAFTIRTDASVIFLAGAATLLLAVLGLVVLMAGLKRARRRRGEMRELRDRARAVERRSAGETAPGRSRDSDQPDQGDPFDSTPRDR
jgi:hypothetical protein